MAKALDYFTKAQKEKFAIGAFNAASLEPLKAIVTAAQKLTSPVMIEASHGEVTYFGLNELVAAVRALEKDYSVPIILNLDHAADIASCKAAIEAGFDYVHFDGSKLPYEENVAAATDLVAFAHQRGVLVEGEIDNINLMGASSADHRGADISEVRDERIYTKPEKAAEFVQATGVDTFASFIGNVHGLYSQPKTLDLGLLGKIAAALPGKFLSLHGGSGIPDEDVRQAVNLGVVKVNVNSELRVAFRDNLEKVLTAGEEPASAGEVKEVAIYKIMPEAIEAMEKIVEAKINLFGSAGKI